MVLGFDVFESRLANVSLLGIYHGLGILMQFERSFSKHARFVEELLNKSSLHGCVTAPDSFRFSRGQGNVSGLARFSSNGALTPSQEEEPSTSGAVGFFVVSMSRVDAAKEYQLHAIMNRSVLIKSKIPVLRAIDVA